MKKITAFLFLFFLININSLSQSVSVRGTAIDSISGTPLISANVILKNLADSTIRGTAANNNGEFYFPSVKPGRYRLTISFIGYKKFENEFNVQNRSIDFEKIYLSPEEVETEEVEVIGTLPPVVQNSDTTEFHADAFKTTTDADAEALVSKMPGITVQDGKVQAQGEDVKRVLVDGKEFFGDDPNAVLKNVPAEIIEKIQVFDEQSEQAQFTGFDDGNTNKTINIITRMRIREGTFGKFTAGFGSAKKYLAGGSINFFNDDQRITILSQINNINEQNFSTEDLLGITASSGGGGRRGGRGSRGFGGGNASDFLVNVRNGISTTKSFGINYANKWNDNIELTSSYFFNLSDNDAESQIQREYFLSANAVQNYSEQNFSSSQNINHRFNMRFEMQFDSLNSIIFRPRLSAQTNEGASSLFGLTTADQFNLNSIMNLFNSDLSALNGSADLLYRHRFETRGRTISISLNSSYKKNDGNNKLFSENLFFDEMTSSDTIDQLSDLFSEGSGGSANVVYTEPLGENSMIQLNSRFSISKDESDQRTFSNDFISGYNDLDTLLSSLAEKKYNSQNYGIGYRFQESGLSINANLNYNLASLNSEQTFPRSFTINKNFNSVLPSFMLRYNFTRDKNIRINYRTNNNDPSVNQLQNVLNNSNPVQLRIGNPDLKQDYRHSLFIRYSEMDMETLHSIFVMLSSTFTNNYIGNNTFIASNDTIVYDGIELNRGTQITRPQNLDGYFNLRSFITYSFPFAFIKSNINLNLSGGYVRTPGVVNNQTGYSNSSTFGLGIVISSNFSRDLDFTISTQSNYSDVKSSLRESSNRNYLTQNSRIRFYWKFWEGFLFQTDFRHQYNGGLPDDYEKNSIQWNINIGKKLFSNESGELRFSVLDILNKDTNIRRETTDLYIEDTRSNVLGRYFILSFIYNLRAF